MSLPHWVPISPIPLRLAMCRVSPECKQSIMLAMIGTWHVTGKQPIGTSLLGHAQWTKWLHFTLFLNPPHFLKDILNILYITSVPDATEMFAVYLSISGHMYHFMEEYMIVMPVHYVTRSKVLLYSHMLYRVVKNLSLWLQLRTFLCDCIYS